MRSLSIVARVARTGRVWAGFVVLGGMIWVFGAKGYAMEWVHGDWASIFRVSLSTPDCCFPTILSAVQRNKDLGDVTFVQLLVF